MVMRDGFSRGVPEIPAPRILSACRLPLDGSWRGRNHRLWFWRIWWNDRPGGLLQPLRGRPIVLDPGITWLIPPGLAMRWEGGAATGGTHHGVHFELDPILERTLATNRPYDLTCDDTQRALARKLPCVEPTAVSTLHAQALVAVVIAAALDTLPAARREGLAVQGTRRRRLTPALDHIAHRYAEAMTVADLAARCGLGADQFTRLCRKATGETPIRLLLRTRLRAAARLLAEGEQPVEAVAETCGFNDRAYFSRRFAHHCGCGPATWRRQHRAQVETR